MTSRNTLSYSLDVMREFRRLDPKMQIHTAEIFLTIAEQEGITLTELGEKVGLAQSSISRNITALSEATVRSNKGLGLVIAKEDPMERRRKIAKLTAKGKRLVETLKNTMGES